MSRDFTSRGVPMRGYRNRGRNGSINGGLAMGDSTAAVERLGGSALVNCRRDGRCGGILLGIFVILRALVGL